MFVVTSTVSKCNEFTLNLTNWRGRCKNGLGDDLKALFTKPRISPSFMQSYSGHETGFM